MLQLFVSRLEMPAEHGRAQSGPRSLGSSLQKQQECQTRWEKMTKNIWEKAYVVINSLKEIFLFL